jgi:flagellar biogenesis protein FliO
MTGVCAWGRRVILSGFVAALCLLVLCADATTGESSDTTSKKITSATGAVSSASQATDSENIDPVLARLRNIRNQKAGIPTNQRTEKSNSGGSMLGFVFRVILSIGVTLLLLYGMLHMLRRHMRVKGGNAPDRVRVVSRTPLSTKSQLFVVEVGGRTLLLGESNTGVSTLCDLSAPEEIESGDGSEALSGAFQQTQEKSAPLSFSNELKDSIKFLRSSGGMTE